jgi:Xaa-Pro aminopeptidase
MHGRPGPAPTAEEPIKGPVADVFLAALTASEVAIKLIKPGNSNKQVTEAMARVAEAFGVNAMQGTLMHQMKRCAF